MNLSTKPSIRVVSTTACVSVYCVQLNWPFKAPLACVMSRQIGKDIQLLGFESPEVYMPWWSRLNNILYCQQPDLSRTSLSTIFEPCLSWCFARTKNRPGCSLKTAITVHGSNKTTGVWMHCRNKAMLLYQVQWERLIQVGTVILACKWHLT